MIVKKLLIGFAIAFPVTLAAAMLVTYLWNLIFHGQSTVDWETAFRLAIMVGITLGIVLPVTRAIRAKKK